jgi:hypothetical protein
MTAVVEVDEQYAQQLQQFIKTIPQSAILGRLFGFSGLTI